MIPDSPSPLWTRFSLALSTRLGATSDLCRAVSNAGSKGRRLVAGWRALLETAKAAGDAAGQSPEIEGRSQGRLCCPGPNVFSRRGLPSTSTEVFGAAKRMLEAEFFNLIEGKKGD